MEEGVGWVAHGILGLVLMFDVLMVGWAPAGPWNDESFTLGVLGVIGITMLYLSWYRWKFKQGGVVPWLVLWKDVRTSGVKVVLVGFGLMLATWSLSDSLLVPPAGGLILNLVGSLMILQGTYALLSSGYLTDS